MHEEHDATFAPSPKDFNLMVLGQIISILGSALLRFALSLYVLDTTGSETAFASIYAVSNIPLLLAPLGGAIADRFNRRLMVFFDFTSSAIVLGLIILMAAGNTSIVMLGIVMVLLSIVSALYTPAVMASIPLLVSSDRMESANGIVQAVQALSAVAAPIMGGVLYGVIGVRALIVISCVAFFLSAVMEIFIKIPFIKREQTGHIIPTIAGDLKDGFRYVLKVPFILKAMVLAALLNLVLSPYFVVGAPIILRVTMQSSDNLYGIGMGLVNAATILGALTIGVFSKKIRVGNLYRWLLLIAVLCLPMALAVAPVMLNHGYYPSYILFMVAAVPIAMIMTILSIYITASVQKTTPNENLGKVMAIIIAVAQCAAPLNRYVIHKLKPPHLHSNLLHSHVQKTCLTH
ncbi:MAG: MFS transporter [Puniceicoccales bacterium]|jgi:MFS family permease|nr:MFS transporter [Puniceicoccales bacterium]